MNELDSKRKTLQLLAIELYKRGLLKTWFRDKHEGWTLVSGLWSPFYLQLRSLSSHPDLMAMIGPMFAREIFSKVPNVTRLIGIAMAGIPIAAVTAVSASLPCGYTRKIQGARDVESLRKLLKEYGEHDLIEGEINNNDVIVLVDDLVTRFDSKLIAIELVTREIQRIGNIGSAVKAVAVLVDREQGAFEEAARAGVALIPLIRFRSDLLESLSGVASDNEIQVISDYLDNTSKFQKNSIKVKLKKMAKMPRI